VAAGETRNVGVCARCGDAVIMDAATSEARCSCGAVTIEREFYEAGKRMLGSGYEHDGQQ